MPDAADTPESSPAETPAAMPAKKRLQTRTRRVLLAVLVMVVAVMVIAPSTHFTDTAMFGEDTWEYQSMAVNFAKGEGFHLSGGFIDDFTVYKFADDEHFNHAIYGPFLNEVRDFNAYRTPGYTTALGLFYKVFGISPLRAKWAQLWVIALAALMLPAIGALTWSRTGYWIGLASIAPMIWLNYKFATEIRTEPLIIFMVAAFVLLGCLYQHRPNWRVALAWGACTGLGVLVKGSMAFFPLFAGLFLVWRWWRDRRLATFLLIVIYSVAFWAVVAPWSIYATIKHGERVVLSTQGPEVILDNHNEYCGDGYWHDEWRVKPDSFYNNDGMDGRSATLRVLNFYAHQPGQLVNKWHSVRLAFVANSFLPIAGLALVALGLLHMLRGPLAQSAPLRAVATAGSGVLIGIGVVGCILSTVNPYQSKAYDGWYLYAYIAAAVLVVIYRRGLRLWVAPAMLMVLMNFLAITVMTGTVDTEYYRSRFIKVADPVHVLLAMYLVLEVVIRLRALWRPPAEEPAANGAAATPTGGAA